MHWAQVNRAPRISVLISSYSSRRFVAGKLDQIRRQTLFEEAEFLFIETGSPEREREEFAPFCQQHSNCRLITTEGRKSLYEAWNLGWENAQAPLLCYSNMDDAMHPLLLERVAGTMESTVAAVCTVLIAKQPLNGEWNNWSPERIATLPLSTRFGAFMAWRTELRTRLGLFDERFKAAGDKEYWSRIAKAKIPVRVIPEILYLYTRNPGSLSQEIRRSHQWQEEKKIAASLRWPATLRWRVRILRCRRRLQPGLGYVPLPENPNASR